MANLKLKSKLQAQEGILLPQETVERVLIIDENGEIKSSSVTEDELAFLGGVASSIQDQLDDKADQEDLDTAVEAIEDLQTLSGVSGNSTDLGEFTGDIIPDGSTIKDALQALETEIEEIPEPLFYAGTYNAATNTPDLDLSGARVSGAVYKVTVAGTHDFDAFGGEITFQLGDKAVFNGILNVWEKWDVQDNENTDQITEGSTNLYFTDERAQDAVGNALVDSNTIDFTYDDAEDEITADVKHQMSIDSDSSGIKLVGDSATPGNDKYYGTNSSGDKGFYDLPTGGSPNDIQETSFSIANDVDTPTSITGFLLDSQVRSFKALVSVEIDATLELYESFELLGVQKNGSFEMAQQSVGDEAGVVFSITSGGQVQYTSANYAGFDSGVIRFRAITTSF
jgi:hypothetical protein